MFSFLWFLAALSVFLSAAFSCLLFVILLSKEQPTTHPTRFHLEQTGCLKPSFPHLAQSISGETFAASFYRLWPTGSEHFSGKLRRTLMTVTTHHHCDSSVPTNQLAVLSTSGITSYKVATSHAYRSTPNPPDLSSTPVHLLQSCCFFLFTHWPKGSIFRRVLRGISHSSLLRLLFVSPDGRSSSTFFYSSGASPLLSRRNLPSVSMYHRRQGVAIDGEELGQIFHLKGLVSSLMFIYIPLSPISTKPVCIINSNSGTFVGLSHHGLVLCNKFILNGESFVTTFLLFGEISFTITLRFGVNLSAIVLWIENSFQCSVLKTLRAKIIVRLPLMAEELEIGIIPINSEAILKKLPVIFHEVNRGIRKLVEATKHTKRRGRTVEPEHGP